MYRTLVCSLLVIGGSAAARAGELDREKSPPAAAVKPADLAATAAATEMDKETPEPAHRYRGGWGGYGWGGHRGFGWGGYGYRSFSVGFGFSNFGWGGYGYPRYGWGGGFGWGGFYPGYARSFYSVGFSYPAVAYAAPAYGWCW